MKACQILFKDMWAALIGGIGIFLLGMSIMTAALKSLAGVTLRRVLARFAGNRLTSISGGAFITALIQSSSATTLMTIGFVSAGLLSFTGAVGVILGANLGTTVTGWLVSIIGFKLSISSFALPMVAVGAFMNLTLRGKPADTGMMLAGFALVFLGIDFMQQGMAGLSDHIDPSGFDASTITGRFLLAGIGIAITVAMQSSSAAVATTLTALHAETINLEQAAALVVGQNIGTTVTAALASIGATIPAKRTAIAHILFNSITGFATLFVFTWFTGLVFSITDAMNLTDTALILSFFHTTFNFTGVLIFIPFLDYFSRLIQRLVPSKELDLTRRLDDSLAHLPTVGIEAVYLTIRETASLVSHTIIELIAGYALKNYSPRRYEAAAKALERMNEFLSKLSINNDDTDRYRNILHSIDHLDSLIGLLNEPEKPQKINSISEMKRIAEQMQNDISRLPEILKDEYAEIDLTMLETLSTDLATRRKNGRREVFSATARGGLTPDETLELIEALRWLDRAAYHLWRLSVHLEGSAIKTSENQYR